MTNSTIETPATQLPPLIPRELLFGNPERTSPSLSPDGKYLAYIAPDQKNILQVWSKYDIQILSLYISLVSIDRFS